MKGRRRNKKIASDKYLMHIKTGTTATFTDDSVWQRNDPTGIDLDTQAWGSLMSKLSGTGLYFWNYEYIEPLNLYLFIPPPLLLLLFFFGFDNFKYGTT